MDDYDGPQVTLWFTDMCPCCENAVMVCDGDTEECQICMYERKWTNAPLDSEPGEWHGEGLA